jgi:transcriptional regulator with XRE-family HTH domain
MNFSQLHERLRILLNRRIDHGLLTGTLLAAQTGLKPSHISNFLRRKRNLSMTALDRVLTAQSLTVDDLVPSRYIGASRKSTSLADRNFDDVPLVSHAAAVSSPAITGSVILEVIHLPSGILGALRGRHNPARRDWHRFVAVRISPDQAFPMFPILRPQSIVVLDRHYSSLTPFRPPQPDIYGVNDSNALIFRYVSSDSRRVILRPYAIEHPIKLVEIVDRASLSDLIVGRVCICISQF